MATKQRESVKKRSHGIAARNKILDAAGEIASERGYEGTSISLVSKRSGFPASSIYWHFKDKDDLISAVIERSFDAWLQAPTEFLPGTTMAFAGYGDARDRAALIAWLVAATAEP